MKTRLLTLAMLLFVLHGFSQTNLKPIITGENGITKHFVKLLQDQQLQFNASQASKILGLSNKSGLVLKNTEKDNLGFVHYRFQQTYLGIPVNNSMYIISTKNGKIVSLSGSIIIDFNAGIDAASNAKFGAKQAIAYALNNVDASEYMWQDKAMEARLKAQFKDASASYYPVAEKCWFSQVDAINPSDLKLAYKIDVFAAEPYSRAYYYIDASNGKLLGKENRIHTADVTGTANTLYSGTQTIHSDQTGANAYRLRDMSRGNGIITLRVGGGDFNNTSANWNLALPDRNALDAHWGVEMTYDFYKANFNRNSIDDNGYALYSYVNRTSILYRDNAFWDGTAMNYGKRLGSQNGVTGIDVTGHELTHGITQNTSSLVYQNETGAMNESMSDIMGKSVQFWAKPSDIDWRLSNDMNWFIRDMSNPNAYQQPDTYNGTYWVTGSSDNGGVHTNSGVGNFMYYLLVSGGSGANDNGDAYNVQGIGLTKAQQIIYRTETVYLTSTSQYEDWREACINAATDLYGATSNETAQVKNAWHAVGIGEASGGSIYCTSKGLSTTNEYINLVNFAGSDYVSGNNGGHGDFTSVVSDVIAGQTTSIQVRAGFTGAVRKEGWTLYIDYNGDSDFSDAGEKIGTAVATSAAILTKTFKIPATAKTGITRMRIQMHYNTVITDPCATFDQGEVEDYSVNITAGSGIAETLISNISVSPNPVKSFSIRVSYTLAKAGNISFKLTDANDIAYGNYKAGIQHKGANSYSINNLSGLHNGYYYLTPIQDGVAIGKLPVLIAH